MHFKVGLVNSISRSKEVAAVLWAALVAMAVLVVILIPVPRTDLETVHEKPQHVGACPILAV
jgi:hypothetical protein